MSNSGSNDTIRSTIHRVRAPLNLKTEDGMTPDRYSIPYVCSVSHLLHVAIIECPLAVLFGSMIFSSGCCGSH